MYQFLKIHKRVSVSRLNYIYPFLKSDTITIHTHIPKKDTIAFIINEFYH